MSESSPESPQKSGKSRKSRAGLSLKEVNLDKTHKKLLNILDRDVSKLLNLSRTKSLTGTQSFSLVNYLKLIKTLKDIELEQLSELSDEELEKKANE